MKKLVCIFILLSASKFVVSQNVGIGTNTPQSKLHVQGAIRSDTLIYTGSPVRYLFAAPNGRIYDSIVAPFPAWLINGNNNITPTQFLGTTNANDVIFKTNNNEVARFTANGKLGIGTPAPNLSSLVEMTSTTNGLLIPRMTTAQRNAIAAPSNGLLVYDLTVNCVFFYHAGLAAWQSLCAPPLPPGSVDVIGTYPTLTVTGLQTTPVSATTPTLNQILQFNGTSWTPTSGTFWNLLGNAGTNPVVNFLGTTDNVDLVFRTNNIEHARISNNGLFHNMQGTFVNTIASDGQGCNTSPGGGASLFWRLNNGGFAGSFYNQSLLANAGGLSVKILATGASNTIFDVSTGNQAAVGVPVLNAKGNGHVGIGVVNPTARLDVYLNSNNTADAIARFTRTGTGSSGNLAFYSGATLGDYNGITQTGDKSIIFDNDNNPLLSANSGLVIAPWTGVGNPNAFSGIKIMENGNVGIGTGVPRAKFDVLNGDAMVADNAFAQGNFNVGRSATSLFVDNIRPFTDNSLRIYDNNSNSHITFDANTVGVMQFYTPAGSAPAALENAATTGVLSINPYGGNVRLGLPNHASPTIFPANGDNPLHRFTVGSGFFLAGNYNTGNVPTDHPGTTWINGVGALAVGMNRNSGRSHVDFWNTTDVTQVAANTNADRGFEFRGYDNTYAERVLTRIDGLGQMFTNGYLALSDKRFKSNIIPNNDLVLNKLMQVKIYNYDLHQPVKKSESNVIEKGTVIKQNDVGVLVQELYELFPNLVYKPKDETKETWSVDYSKLSLYVLQGVKEQQNTIVTQKQEIEDLKKQLIEINNRLNKVEGK